jgi:putative DNA primase/helicase
MRIPERQKELDALVREYLTDPKPEKDGGTEHRPLLEASDEEVLALCRKAKNAARFTALYDGDTSRHGGDESRADLALVSMFAFYSQDPDQLDRLFDNSALGQRSKWKNRPDYRRLTIKKALGELRETYTPPGGRAHLAGGGVRVSVNGRRIGDNPECFNLTDLGNAERFVAQHGRNVRYCYPWAKWLTWTGSKWARDDAGRVHRLAKETVRSVYGEAATAEDEAHRKALAKHAASSEAKNRIEAMLELAKSDVPVSPDELDADPDRLNASNGTINLRTGELRPHRREDLLTKIAGADYDPDAPAPAWDAFLERVLPGEELRRFVRKAAGYSATGDTSEQVMFINHGVGANGKSTFQEALSEALGDYSMRAPTEMLMVKRSGGVPNDVARLKGARFVSASETEQGRHLAESLVKDLTGTDTITARFMRAEFFDFEPTHKLWLSTNHKPIIRGTDLAIWRRIRLVPWAVTIPPQEQNKQLSSRIQDELPGVLSWVVRGCLDWRREGLAVPDEVRKATGDYRSEMDTLGDFLEDRCVVDPDTSVAFNNLWKAYREWCLDTEEKGESKKQFGMSLTERGFVAHKGRHGVRIRRGLRLKEDFEPDSEKRSATGVADDPTCATQEMSCKPAENAEGGGACGSDLHINTRKISLREVNVKTAPHAPPAPPEPVSFDLQAGESVTVEEDHIQGLIANPPEWLSKQLAKCREDSDRFLKPTSAAIAQAVYATGTRWDEIEPALHRWLEEAR